MATLSETTLQLRALRNALQGRCAFVRNMIRAGNEPSEEQLQGFVEIVKTEARNLAGPAGIDEAEWEEKLQTLCQDGEAPPPADELDDLIDGIVAHVRQLEIVSAQESAVPTEAELESLSLACNELWELDVNRLEPGLDYTINLGEGKSFYDENDAGELPLFQYMDRHVFNRPTFSAFFQLLDNYERSTGQTEEVDTAEKQENWNFLNAAMNTACMKYCYRYLSQKGALPEIVNDEEEFKAYLYELWFALYRRENHNDSSGFEHVFVGEERDGKVSGMHNWIQLLIEERNGRLDYKGFIEPRSGENPTETSQVLPIQFAWGGEMKPISTSFIGVSPEFELAIYTLCFLAGEESNDVTLGPYELAIKVHKIGYSSPKIGSSFPQI